MDLILTLNLDPRMICTAQQKGACIRAGRIRFYTKRAVADSNYRIKNAVLDALDEVGVTMKRGRGEVADTVRRSKALRLDVTYLFRWPDSTPKSKTVDFAWMLERPDLDNLTKSIQDCLTEVRLWEDDSQVAVLHLEKRRVVEHPRIIIRVRTLEDCGNPDGSCCPIG